MPILWLFEPQKPYQEVYPEAAVESTKDDEIPVNVADTGESGFGVCFCLRRASLTAGIRHGGYAWT